MPAKNRANARRDFRGKRADGAAERTASLRRRSTPARRSMPFRAATTSRPTFWRAISRPGVPTSRPISIRAEAGPTVNWPSGSIASAPRCARSAIGARSASCWRCSTPSTGRPLSSARSRPASSPIPVNTLMTEDDYRFMLADSRASVLVVSEELFPKFANLIEASPDLAHVIVSGANAQGHRRFEDLLTSAPCRSPTPRRPPATTCASGSTPRARPASPRARCTPTPICRSPPTSMRRPCLGLRESDVCYLGGQAVLRLRARQRHDVSADGRAPPRFFRPTARRRTASRKSCASIR